MRLFSADSIAPFGDNHPMIVFALLALIGFTISGVVHLASWANLPLGIDQTWPLHVGAFVTVIPAMLGQKKEHGDKDSAGGKLPH